LIDIIGSWVGDRVADILKKKKIIHNSDIDDSIKT
jgi:hypothetical protein